MLIAGSAVIFSALNVDAAKKIMNYAANRVPLGTFKSAGAAVDGSEATYALSGNIGSSPQMLTIDMGEMIYVGTVLIKWDPKAASRNYALRFGKSPKDWMTQWSKLDATKAPRGSQIINTTKYVIPTRYVQIYIPIGSSATADNVRIAEIQVLPAENLSFRLQEVKPYAVGDNYAIVTFRTSIGAASGQVLYGSDPARLDRIASANTDTQLGSAKLVGLTAGKTYFYKVKAWDTEGNLAESRIGTIKPFKIVSRYKAVNGTFVNLPPNDRYVDRKEPVLKRVVDGKTGYFTSMATSGSVGAEDQYVTVDLGSNQRLNSVVTYWRALAYPENFEVKVSRDGKKWDDVGIFNAAEGAFARSDTGDPMKIVNIEARGRRARYVQVRIPKDSPIYTKHAIWDFVQLMEVEVTI
jgi:hypothetical protein